MTSAREALQALASALPPGAAVTLPVEWLNEILAGSGVLPEGSLTASADLTVAELAGRFGRAPATVRGWLEQGRFPGSYRLLGREWRVPSAALAAFEAAERERRPNGAGVPPRRRYRLADLGAWRTTG